MLDREIGSPQEIGQVVRIKAIAVECPNNDVCSSNCPIGVKPRIGKCLIWKMESPKHTYPMKKKQND